MSVRVDIDVLEATTTEYGWAYLLTVGDDERPKIVAMHPEWHDGVLCLAAGGGSARNAAARSAVTLTYPPLEPDGYSLIVDGVATVDDSGDEPRVHVTPTGAVLHRPAPEGFSGSATGCGNDCAPVG